MRINLLTGALLFAFAVMPVCAGHLHSAAHMGDVAALRRLAERGADVNETDSSGVAPLHYAARMGHTDAVMFLVSQGADVDIRSKSERNTPLHLASAAGQNEAAELLLENGAVIDPANNADQTPLHWAIENGRTEMVELLLTGGADIEARDEQGITPLHRAVKCGYYPLIHMLLGLGADPEVRDSNGVPPLKSALKRGYIGIARLLRLAGASIETRRDLTRFIQSQLWLRGYGITEMDGITGPNTASAIKAYQRHAGLPENGAVSEALANHLSQTGEIRPYLTNDRETVTNVFVSWQELAHEHAWEPGLLWSRAELIGEGASGIDHGFRGAMKYSGHVRFGTLEIEGTVWVVANGWVIAHGSKVNIGTGSQHSEIK